MNVLMAEMLWKPILGFFFQFFKRHWKLWNGGKCIRNIFFIFLFFQKDTNKIKIVGNYNISVWMAKIH